MQWCHWQCCHNHVMPVEWCYMTKKSCFIRFQSSWPKECNGVIYYPVRIMWCWQQHEWHHMTKMWLNFDCLILRNAAVHCVIPSPVPMLAHDQKCHVELHFYHLDLRNEMVHLKLPLVSQDSNANAIGITWPTKSCCSSVSSFLPKECNGDIDNVDGIMWCQHCYQ